MGTSASNSGGRGGAWTGFKRNASAFAKHGGRRRAEKALAGHVGTLGGAAGAVASAGAGVRTGQSLAQFLVGSTGPSGVAGGLDVVGLGHLVGADRFTVLSELLDRFAGAGSDLESQAARDALLDVLDGMLPEGGVPLDDVRLDEASVIDLLREYLSALIYNRAIPVIDERLTRLENQQLAQRRDRELHEYIEALVRLRTDGMTPLSVDWSGQEGSEFIEALLRAVYGQIEAWE
jgi:hypothetical protein